MNIVVAGERYEVKYVDTLERWAPVENFFTFDTETTGLHIKMDKPFLAAICFGHTVQVFRPTIENLRKIVEFSKVVERVYGHNVKYDMHMTANQGVDPLQITNWGDTMGLCRLVVEAKSPRHGGDKIGLKEMSKKYLDSHADKWEKDVKAWLKQKKAQDKRVLTALLHGINWTVKQLKEVPESEWPADVTDTVENWRKCYPEPTYQDVPLDLMLPYLAVDVILTRLWVLKAWPIIKNRQMESVVEREFNVLPVIYKMERAGIKVDRKYLEDCRTRISGYIEKLYAELHELTGQEFTVGQHKVIKEYYTDVLGKEPDSVNKKFLKKRVGHNDRVATIISRLRTLEKWLETYIEHDLKISEFDGRMYTQFNQFGAVSGRFSGDLQQMPKLPIYTDEGYRFEKEHPNEKVPKEYILYHPRRAFVVDDADHYLYYMDFSQVELRVQAHYTLAFGGDVNMCRAYCPYKCIHHQTGEEYSFDQKERWSERRDDGSSVWIVPKTGTPWKPTDVHMATTLKALVAMGMNPDEMDKDLIKDWRKKGKQFNFGRNYGMGKMTAAEQLEIPEDQAEALVNGYTQAFPKVVDYQNAVTKVMTERGYAINLYGRRYYLFDSNKFYTVANFLVQGSCSDDLKSKMIKIDKFITDNHLKTKIVLCIHDELVFSVHKDELWAIPKIKEIMEYTPLVKIPIVAEVEYTSSSWDAKRSWEG